MVRSGYGGGAGIVALAASYFLSQFYRSFLAVLYPALSADIGLDEGWLSLASGAWFMVFAAAQFPIGWALDRFGPRRTAAVLHGVGAGGGAALFAVATGPVEIVIAMGLIGLGCAPVLMASFYIYAREFRVDRFATYAATLVAVGTLGNVFAAAPLSALSEAVGWRNAALAIAAATIAVGLACGLFVRDPAPLPREPGAKPGSLRDVLALREIWPILPLMFVGYAASANLRGAWAGPYFSELYGWSIAQIGEATLYMAIGMALGALIYGPLDRVFGSQKRVNLVGSSIVAAICLLLAVDPSGSPERAALLFALIGFAGANYSVIMAHGRGFLSPALIGRGVTLLNFFSIAGAGLMQLLSGHIVQAAGGAEAGAAAFSALFAFYAASMIIALLIYLASKERATVGAH